MAVWRDTYLESLGARNYSEETRDGRRGALDHFLAWAAERDMTKAGEITRPVLEAYQRWLWKLVRPGGKRRFGPEPGIRPAGNFRQSRIRCLQHEHGC